MDLKFFLNKFAKVDNIEGYTLKSLNALKDRYQDYMDSTEGMDPDFPMITFGGDRGKKIKGRKADSGEEEKRIEIGEKPQDPLGDD